MHREISHNDEVFTQSSNAGLYLLTTLLSVLLVLDLWPPLARWLISLGLGIDWPTWQREVSGYRYALIAAIVGGSRVLFNSLEALLEGKLGADLAIAIACIAAILIHEPLVAAEVILIGLIGECLEAYTFARTQSGIRKLVEVLPRQCWLLRDNQETAVNTDELRVGDRLLIKPGKKIPVDGVVIEGRSAVDTSALTGESMPIDKEPGDEILAGSINQQGRLIVEARKVASATVAGKVMELTAQALKDKAPIQREVDRLARYFLPAVLGLALLSFIINVLYLAGPFRPESSRLGWSAAVRLSMYPTLGVLVVACPCALVLATPAAILAALGRLSGTGVLIKGSAVLERLAKVQVFAFDKTGTLTEGRLELGDIVAVPGVAEDEVLRAAALAEQGSEHPIAQVLVRSAQERSLPLDNQLSEFQSYPGGGVAALVSGQRLLVGTKRLLEAEHVAIPPAILEGLADLDAKGQSSLLVAQDGVVLGIIGTRDTIRPDAADVVAHLRSSDIGRIMLLTGDRKAAAQRVGETVRIDEVHAELLPADKAALISGSETPGSDPAGDVAFVGDGINDAPALACASVGIAVSGTDIAAEAGNVVLLGEPLRHLPLLVRLSRETMRIIRQNIIRFAFGVNLVGVIITGILWPFFASSPDWYDKSPLFGVIYHQLGSLLVLFNSMRLLAFERPSSQGRWQRWSDQFAFFDLWMQRHFTVDSLLHELTHRRRSIAGGLALIAGIAWGASGLAAVSPGQVGVLKRFGRIEKILEPGLHVRWPWPVENVIVLSTGEPKTVGLGYRSPSEEDDNEDRPRSFLTNLSVAEKSQAATWTSAHGGTERYAEEGTMITGDGNLVEILATVEYRINDPKQYLLAARQRKSMIRSALESVLREEVAGQTFADLLTIDRAHFENSAGTLLRRRLRELAPEGLGIQLHGLIIHDLHPPKAVVADYYEVARAIQTRDKLINEGHTEAIRKRGRAEEDAIRLVNSAHTAANEQVGRQQAEMAQILALQQARQHLEMVDEITLITQLQMALMLGQDPSDAGRDYLLRRGRTLALRRSLIDMRLAWEALTDVLRKRDKVILDIEKIPGKRHLFLVDPEWLRPALLVPQR